MKKHTIAALVLAASMGLAGCSAGGTTTSAESEPTPTETKQVPVENIAKTWTFDYQGASGTFKLSGNQSGDALTGLETARASVNGTQYTFVPVELDNTNGSTSLNMYGVTVITKEGQQVDSVSLQDVFSSWRDAAGDDTDKYNAIVDASNEYGQFDLQPGAKGTAVVAFAQPVSSAWRVTVAPAGGTDQVEAVAS
ncbi:hypothetical protein [Curtobacterium sp. MCBA15_004]|uniref:hypothetical protein n=1 Tax=Curtobacterium sp. MCBA15_004 TaxID=1898733 RepID=UPI0008DCC946|nr:hypothetical protein [Curtobacterium sp. MCBA15_004]WIA95775.1 hypothetical protein QOL16_11715 [Curtobacterium sp. MCBA15_004]